MKFVSINNLKPGDAVSQNIYSSTNQLLVKSGSKISEYAIAKLRDLGIEGLYIETEFTGDINIEELIPNELKNKSITDLKNLNITSTIANAKEIVANILAQKDISLDYIDIRNNENYSFQHSIAVAESAIVIGKSMDLSEQALVELATAALLHDIGKLCVDNNVMKKVRLVMKKEVPEYVESRHPEYGYCLLADNYDIKAIVKAGILLHHINEDRTGFPKFENLPSNIHLYAKIIHVADEYDEKKHHEDIDNPSEAFEYLMGGCGTLFNQEIVEKFREFIPVYPLGTTVVLSNGNSAIVIAQNKGVPLRPKLVLISGLNRGSKIDLMSSDTLNITVTGIEDDYQEANTRSK